MCALKNSSYYSLVALWMWVCFTACLRGKHERIRNDRRPIAMVTWCKRMKVCERKKGTEWKSRESLSQGTKMMWMNYKCKNKSRGTDCKRHSLSICRAKSTRKMGQTNTWTPEKTENSKKMRKQASKLARQFESTLLTSLHFKNVFIKSMLHSFSLVHIAKTITDLHLSLHRHPTIHYHIYTKQTVTRRWMAP